MNFFHCRIYFFFVFFRSIFGVSFLDCWYWGWCTKTLNSAMSLGKLYAFKFDPLICHLRHRHTSECQKLALIGICIYFWAFFSDRKSWPKSMIVFLCLWWPQTQSILHIFFAVTNIFYQKRQLILPLRTHHFFFFVE